MNNSKIKSEILESIVLGLADDGLTAKTIAYVCSCGINDASQALQSLVTSGELFADNSFKNGTVYTPVIDIKG